MESYKVYKLSIFDHFSRLWSSCVLCDRPSGRHLDLCDACECELPWLENPCPRCAYPLAPGQQHCPDCAQHPPLQRRTHSLLRYEFPVNRLVTGFKYHQQLPFGRVLAELLAFKLVNTLPLYDYPAALIPLPLHPHKQISRGFNQAILIAQVLARRLKLPLYSEALIKVVATQVQAGLNAEQRQSNLENAFQFFRPARLPEHVALVDDVLTTGATARAATATLLGAGVKQVDVWTLARTP